MTRLKEAVRSRLFKPPNLWLFIATWLFVIWYFSDTLLPAKRGSGKTYQVIHKSYPGGNAIVNEAVVNEKEVYATFLSTRVGGNASSGEMEYDWYFNSTRVLIHRLLRNESTRGHRNVIVLVTENVEQWKRDRLAADGAIVKLVPILSIPNLPTREAIWIDQFTKLQLWKLVEFDRIVYMDSDLLPLTNTEELFSMDIDQSSLSTPSINYSFAASPNLVAKRQDGRELIGNGFNAGFFMLQPSLQVFDRIWKAAIDRQEEWNVHNDMEQGLLNWMFASGGEYPMFRLHWKWNVKDMPDELMRDASVVHARWWLNDPQLVGVKQMAEWWRTYGQVEGVWGG